MRILPIALIAAAAVTAAPRAARADDAPWCTLVGSYSYRELDGALRMREQLRGRGFADAGVYDTRDFTDLAWGQLAVIATRHDGATARKPATDDDRALTRARLPAYAKPCHAAAGAAAVERADQIRPLPAMPTAPAQPRFDRGCLGWSPARSVAACIVGDFSIQGGGSWRAELLGSDAEPIVLAHSDGYGLLPKELTSDARGALASALAGGHFVRMPDARPIEPGTIAHWALPRFTITWQRRKLRKDGDGGGGTWWYYADRIEVTCGSQRALLVEHESPSSQPTGNVYVIPGGTQVVVDATFGWGIEGDMGAEAFAWLVDTDGCKVTSSTESP
jgi:hypothetical protein